MVKRLEGKVAVVTGAGRGIGRGEALALAAEGAKVVVNDLGGNIDGTNASTSPADDVVIQIKKFGGEAVANYESVATPEGGNSIVRTAIDNFGRIDILVNNAGIVRTHMIFNMSDEEWDLIIKVHLYGHFYCTRAACVHFRQQRSGRIINTSSTAGLGVVGGANYGAAKEGILGFTKGVAWDMGKYGVTCNAITPTADTRLGPNTHVFAQMEKAKALGVINPQTAITQEDLFKCRPEMIAPLVVYLATDEAANINGCNFWVAGGEIGIFHDREVRNSIYKDNFWTLDELVDIIPKSLAKGLVNPAPPEPSRT